MAQGFELPGRETANCWCEPAKPGKCWQRSARDEQVQHILKGGEDTVGREEAIQRVYFNIGSCAEQCWLNHVSDTARRRPGATQHGQTPMDIGQCRRDCASFRAIEDRLGDVAAFFVAQRPTASVAGARIGRSAGARRALDQEFGAGLGRARPGGVRHAPARGAIRARADTSSRLPRHGARRSDAAAGLPEQREAGAGDPGWNLSRRAHALEPHAEPGVGRVLGARPCGAAAPDPNLKEMLKGGGRGYYRPPSLLERLGLRATHAQQRDGSGAVRQAERSERSTSTRRPTWTARASRSPIRRPACRSTARSERDGRFKLFKDSMEELLNPGKRIPKVTLTDEDVIVDIAPQTVIGGAESGFSLVVPEGHSRPMLINSLRIKDLIQDLVLIKRRPAELAAQYQGILTPDQLRELQEGLERLHVG